MSNFIFFCRPTGQPHYNEEMALKYSWFNFRLRRAQTGVAGVDGSFTPSERYLGIHHCTSQGCQAVSTDYDIKFLNGLITNSLTYHYLVYHTAEVVERDLELLEQMSGEIEDMFVKCSKCKQYQLKHYKGNRLLKTCKECKRI